MLDDLPAEPRAMTLDVCWFRSIRSHGEAKYVRLLSMYGSNHLVIYVSVYACFNAPNPSGNLMSHMLAGRRWTNSIVMCAMSLLEV